MSDTRPLSLRFLLLLLLSAAVLFAACGSDARSFDTGTGSSTEAAPTSDPPSAEPPTTAAPATTTTTVGTPTLSDVARNKPIPEGRWQVKLGLASVSFETDGRLLLHRDEDVLRVGLDVSGSRNEIVIAYVTGYVKVPKPEAGPLPSNLREWFDESAFVNLTAEGTLDVDGAEVAWFDFDTVETPGSVSCHLGSRCLALVRASNDYVHFLPSRTVRVIDLRRAGGVMLFVNADPESFDDLASTALDLAAGIRGEDA